MTKAFYFINDSNKNRDSFSVWSDALNRQTYGKTLAEAVSNHKAILRELRNGIDSQLASDRQPIECDCAGEPL